MGEVITLVIFSDSFSSLCMTLLKNISPYTPKKNGVVESKNREIMEMANFILHSHDMKLSFWVEVIVCATHIINHIPTCATTGTTPYGWLHG